jgi:hypothetical protein
MGIKRRYPFIEIYLKEEFDVESSDQYPYGLF